MNRKIRMKLRIARFVEWLFDRHTCWADCVSWAFSDSWNVFRIGRAGLACKIESQEHSTGMCYCGKWYEGKLFKESDLAKEPVQPISPELPF